MRSAKSLWPKRRQNKAQPYPLRAGLIVDPARCTGTDTNCSDLIQYPKLWLAPVGSLTVQLLPTDCS